MDVLSDVLRMIRLHGALFLHASFGEPWCVEVPQRAVMAQLLQPGARRLAICHLVTEGGCWVRRDAGGPVLAQQGDVIVLPHGDAHWLGSGPAHAPIDLAHRVDPRVPEMRLRHYGGEGARTVLVCGWFAYEGSLPDPLISTLPAVFRAEVAQRPSGPWLAQSIRYAVGEAASARPGSSAVAARVAEALFVEALRAHIESLPPAHIGWLAGLRDPHIGRCLALMHAEPARAWTVDALATAVHSSRSALAARFGLLVGMPPMQYLKRWRLALAARLLCSEGRTLTRIAEDVGYESQAAFNRAFKQHYGVPPGVWRRSSRTAGDAPAAAAGDQAVAPASMAAS